MNPTEIYTLVAFPSAKQEEWAAHVQSSQNQLFHYGEATFKHYSTRCNGRGWEARKIQSLPFALVGFLKTIYQFTIALILSIPHALQGQSDLNKTSFFKVARELEESCGWIITLFNDKLGTYLIAEAQFQKQCYGIFFSLSQKHSSSSENGDRNLSASSSTNSSKETTKELTQEIVSSSILIEPAEELPTIAKPEVKLMSNLQDEKTVNSYSAEKLKSLSNEERSDFIKNLDVNKMNDSLFNALFKDDYNKINYDLLTSEQRIALLAKFDYFIKVLSPKHYDMIDTAKLSQSQIDLMFPTCNRQIIYLDCFERQAKGQLKKEISVDAAAHHLLKAREISNKVRAEALTPEQRKDIKEKLSFENSQIFDGLDFHRTIAL